MKEEVGIKERNGEGKRNRKREGGRQNRNRRKYKRREMRKERIRVYILTGPLKEITCRVRL